MDRILGLGAVFLAIPVGVASWSFGAGTPKSPGPGFWPFLIALCIAGLGASLALRPDPTFRPPSGEGSRWRSFGVALASLALFILVLEPLGYLVTTFGLLVVQLRWVEGRSRQTTLLIAGIAALVSFALFRVVLKVPLPVGIVPLPRGW